MHVDWAMDAVNSERIRTCTSVWLYRGKFKGHGCRELTPYLVILLLLVYWYTTATTARPPPSRLN